MKTYFYGLLLGSLFIAPVWADSYDSEPTNEEKGITIEVNLDDEDASDDKISAQELETKIKNKVFSIIGDIIEAASDDMTEDEKAEIKREIKKAIQEIKEVNDDDKFIHFDSVDDSIFDDGITFLEALIPLTAIVMVFGTPIFIVAGVLYSSYRKKRLMHDTIDQYVSSGKDIPPEVLKGLQKEVTPKSNLHRGLVMSGIGLGIFACFAVIGSLDAAAFGLIPFFIGLAQLLIWKLESK